MSNERSDSPGTAGEAGRVLALGLNPPCALLMAVRSEPDDRRPVIVRLDEGRRGGRLRRRAGPPRSRSRPLGRRTRRGACLWDLVGTETGVLYAATGGAGKVFRREGQGAWSVAFVADDTRVFSLAVLSDGRVFAGNGPGGQVVDLTDPKHPLSRPGPDVKYI